MPRRSHAHAAFPPDGEDAPASAGLGVGFAWEALIELQELVRGADQKASIVLTLAAAIAGVVISGVGDPGDRLEDVDGVAVVLLAGSLAALAVAFTAALLVILPRLGRRRTGQGATNDLLFFGVVRLREPRAVARQLRALDGPTAVDQLAEHLVKVSRIAWRKHALLQVSVWAFLAGAALLGAALLAA